MAKKASARGKRKKPVVRKKNIKIVDDRPKEMIMGEKTYTVGDVAHYVCEHNASPSRPKTSQGELTGVYPDDSIEPCVGLRDYETGKHRVVRARLIGWSSKEALANYKTYLKTKK